MDEVGGIGITLSTADGTFTINGLSQAGVPAADLGEITLLGTVSIVTDDVPLGGAGADIRLLVDEVDPTIVGNINAAAGVTEDVVLQLTALGGDVHVGDVRCRRAN